MRRFWAITLSILILAVILLGCNQGAKNAPPNDDKDPPAPIVKIKPQDDKKDDKKTDIEQPANPNQAAEEKQQKFDAALAEAIGFLAERKWNDALAAFETAREIDETDFVKAEIAKLKERIDQDGTTKATVKNLETVINEGKAEEAVKLASDALKEFGDGDDANKLVQLKLQADALLSVQKDEANDARHNRFRAEGDAALREKNLRAAALAFEQALLAREDAELQKAYEDIRDKLDKYDALRKKSAELRCDPAKLEEAIDALKQAAFEWDTVQLRTETDELLLALQRRRDTVSVADFDTTNDLGVADAGAAIADEILPRLKAKYDLVERAQLNRVIQELKLDDDFADDAQQREEIGKLAKVRYLVVGSIRQLGGITVQARLVDVRTGLVVQTAKIVAPNLEDAMNQAPDLAKQLLMTDDEKMAFDAQMQQRGAKKVEVVAPDAAVQPAPLPPGPDMPKPPQFRILNPAPPVFGEDNPELLGKFQPAPAQIGVVPIEPPPPQIRQRALVAALEMGDDLFRAGRFRDAHRHFEFALNLAPGHVDVQLRIERVRPLLPPPPVVVVPQPMIIAKPRIAVLPFIVKGRPHVVPPSLSYWTPSHLAPYFNTRYDVADPAEIYWFMGRMGITMHDLMVDPHARRWLGRATGVRYFVLGSHVETFSFDVNTYLVDAEFGYLLGSARINVQNWHELKFRLPELATVTMMSPAERAVYYEAQRQQRFEQFVVLGRKHIRERNFALAVNNLEQALQLRPGVVQIQMDLIHARDALRVQLIQDERRREYEARQAAIAAQRQRQIELAHQAEAARRRAIAEAAARDEAERRSHVLLRFQAQNRMVSQAQIALKTKNFGMSVSLFQGATHLAPVNVQPPIPMTPPNVLYQDFAEARLEAERQVRQREIQVAAAREAALRRSREQQVIEAQQALIAEQKRQLEAQEATRKAMLDRDNKAFKDAIGQGQGLMAKEKYEAALAAFQSAQRFAHGPEQRSQVTGYIDIIVQRQAEALAKSKEEKAEIERKLLVERERRRAAERQAKQNEENYKLALQLAMKALNERNYDVAQQKYEEAGKIYRTDAVLTGLRQVDDGRAALLAAEKKQQAEAKKAERVKQFVADGNAALTANKYVEAVSAFQQAKKLAPDNLEVMTGLTRAEQLRDRLAQDTQRKTEEAQRAQNFQRFLKSGQENLANKQYEAAVAMLKEAVKLNPTDKTAALALQQAEKARDVAVTDKAAAKARAEAYQKHMNDGQLALASKRYADAIKAFSNAQQVLPGDKASSAFLLEAQNEKKTADAAIALATKQRAEEAKKAADLQKALTQGRAALAANDLTAATKLLNQAKALAPNDADVLRALRDLDQATQRQTAEIAAQKKRLTEFQGYLDAGKIALNAKRYPEALKALSSATTLMPQNKEAQDLFRRAQFEQRQAEEAAAKAKLQEHLTTGQNALKLKNYDAAEKAFRAAGLVDPSNPIIVQGLKEIEQGRRLLQEEKQKQAAFQLAVSAGQKAMNAKNYTEAIKSFRQALTVMPNDPGTTKLLQQAQQAFDNAVNEAKLQASYKLAMDNGAKAMNQRNYKDAIKAFQDAVKLYPNDKSARQSLLQAQQALTNIEQAQINYTKAMNAGQNAMQLKKYPEAIKSFSDALKWAPNDPQATKLLQQAQQAQQAVDAGLEAERKQYASILKQAESAMQLKKYEDAIGAYQSLLKLRPKDTQALQGLQSAQKALDASKVKTPNPYDQAMQRGNAAEKDRKYGDAIKAFQEALKLRPKDNDASAGLRRNNLYNHVAVGQAYLNNGMFLEAQREFDAALKIAPGDKEIQKLLDKAKKKMK